MRCQFTKETGEHCGANAVADSTLCFSHNPQTQEAKHEAVVKGGLASRPQRPSLGEVSLSTMADVISLLGQTINEVRGGQIDQKTANCVGFLAGHLMKAIEVGDLEQKMKAIENLVSSKGPSL